MNREPLLTRGVILAVVTALIGVVVAFGVDLTPEQTGAILTFVGALAPLIVAILARPKVTADVDVAARVGEEARMVAGPASPLPDGLPVRVVPSTSPTP